MELDSQTNDPYISYCGLYQWILQGRAGVFWARWSWPLRVCLSCCNKHTDSIFPKFREEEQTETSRPWSKEKESGEIFLGSPAAWSKVTYKRKYLICLTVSGYNPWWQSKGMNSWELTSWSTALEERASEHWELNKSLETSKLTPSDTPSPTRPRFLILPNQFQQLGSSIQASESVGAALSQATKLGRCEFLLYFEFGECDASSFILLPGVTLVTWGCFWFHVNFNIFLLIF